MAKVSEIFHLRKTQSELDFVDVRVHTDNLLFVDPFAISQRPDRWSIDCHQTVSGFFQRVIDSIRSGNDSEARELLSHLREPNETRLGLSRGRPQGAGIGRLQAEQLYLALKGSSAVKTGFITSLEECELMVEGIGFDKLSDITTNIIRGELVSYTREQCKLHNIPTENVALPPIFDPQAMQWAPQYVAVPVVAGCPLLLVPKAIVRYDPAYQHPKYYRYHVLNYLQLEALEAGSSLVRTLKNRKRVVYKKELAQAFPCTKEFLYQFSKDHPQVLKQYRDELAKLNLTEKSREIDVDDERAVAQMLAVALKAIPRGGDSASNYHRLMIGIVEFLFFPHLIYPRKETEIHEGRKRIDITMENGARDGIFWRISEVRRLPCGTIFFECKNYRTDVGNPELDQLSGRFSGRRGMVGFLCCRNFEDRALFVQRCIDTFKDDRGLIVPLDDRTIVEFLDRIRRGERSALDHELSKLVAEVCL